MNYDGLLFDYDGVIADTEPLHWKSWCAALEPYGLSLSWEEYCRWCRGTAYTRMREPLERLNPAVSRVVDLESGYLEAKQRLFSRLADDPPIAAGTVRMLQNLRGLRAGLVTTAKRESVEPVLRAAGIYQIFQAQVYREDVEHPKPAPDAYLLGAQRLGARRILVFEDTLPGVEAARAAGLDVVFVEDCAQLDALVERAVYSGSR